MLIERITKNVTVKAKDLFPGDLFCETLGDTKVWMVLNPSNVEINYLSKTEQSNDILSCCNLQNGGVSYVYKTSTVVKINAVLVEKQSLPVLGA